MVSCSDVGLVLEVCLSPMCDVSALHAFVIYTLTGFMAIVLLNLVSQLLRADW